MDGLDLVRSLDPPPDPPRIDMRQPRGDESAVARVVEPLAIDRRNIGGTARGIEGQGALLRERGRGARGYAGRGGVGKGVQRASFFLYLQSLTA